MKTEELLKQYNFIKIDNNEFQRENWTVRLEGLNFEIFSDPEIDTRYYFGLKDKLELCLKAIS